MDLSLTESQELLRSAARAFVEREAPGHVIVGLQREDSRLPAALWRPASGARPFLTRPSGLGLGAHIANLRP